MYRIDLHTHSVASPDGGLSVLDYERMLTRRGLDIVAVTDHNSIDFALQLQQRLGDAIIVGEEIKTTQGEIVGLYLKQLVQPGLSAADTVTAIREQGGLVYIPHPFETVRQGISEAVLRTIAGDVDIIETHNGRAVFQNRSQVARAFKVQYGWAGAASSDAHSAAGWGRTYSTTAERPDRDTLVSLLLAADYTHRHPGLRGLAAPKMNRLRKKLSHA